MASLAQQLKVLQPLLVNNTDLEDLQRKLLKDNEEEFFSGNRLNLIDKLAGMGESHFYTYPNKDHEGGFIRKVNQLLQEEGCPAQVEAHDPRGEWTMQIEGSTTVLGQHETYRWHLHAHEILNIPGFYRNIALALKKYLVRGSFFYGYIRNEEVRQVRMPVFMVVYLEKENEYILKEYDELEWIRLGESMDSRQVESVSYSKDPSGSYSFSYRNQGTYLTTIVIFMGIFVVFGIANRFMAFSEMQFSYPVLLLVAMAGIILAILDFINRTSRLTIDTEKLFLRQGMIPFLPGYGRINIEVSDIIRVWTKSKVHQIGTTDTGPTMYKSMAVYITTRDGKEIRITGDIEYTEAQFLHGKIEEFTMGLNNAHDPAAPVTS